MKFYYISSKLINFYNLLSLDNSQEESSNSSATSDFVFLNTLIGK